MSWPTQSTLKLFFCATCTVLLVFFLFNPSVGEDLILSRGQTVYVPVYSNIFSSPKKIPNDLANILSIRNTDMLREIRINAVDYYDSKGKIVKNYYPQAATLGPLESVYIYISEKENEGGLGANFIVNWEADQEVNAPIIECIMAGSQGRAFITSGHVIHLTGK